MISGGSPSRRKPGYGDEVKHFLEGIIDRAAVLDKNDRKNEVVFSSDRKMYTCIEIRKN